MPAHRRIPPRSLRNVLSPRQCSGAVSLQKSVLFHELTETVTDWANLFFDRDGSENGTVLVCSLLTV